MKETIREFDNSEIKITVEETKHGFIATFWEKNMEFEVDRRVEEFETEGGAVLKAFDMLTSWLTFGTKE